MKTLHHDKFIHAVFWLKLPKIWEWLRHLRIMKKKVFVWNSPSKSLPENFYGQLPVLCIPTTAVVFQLNVSKVKRRGIFCFLLLFRAASAEQSGLFVALLPLSNHFRMAWCPWSRFESKDFLLVLFAKLEISHDNDTPKQFATDWCFCVGNCASRFEQKKNNENCADLSTNTKLVFVLNRTAPRMVIASLASRELTTKRAQMKKKKNPTGKFAVSNFKMWKPSGRLIVDLAHNSSAFHPHCRGTQKYISFLLLELKPFLQLCRPHFSYIESKHPQNDFKVNLQTQHQFTVYGPNQSQANFRQNLIGKGTSDL